MHSLEAKAIDLLRRSLVPIAQELNELDWKTQMSPNKERLKEHLSAFANYSGGGFLIFGINNDGAPVGIDQSAVNGITHQIANLASAAFNDRVQISHGSIDYNGVPLLAVQIHEAIEKPIHLRGKSIDESYIRSGGQTRKMSRQDLRVAIANSRTHRFEEMPAPIQTTYTKLEDILDYSAIVARTGVKFIGADQFKHERLHELKMLAKTSEGFVPTNLGLLACAKDLSKLPTFERYAVRVLSYQGVSKVSSVKRERIFSNGFTLSLDEIVAYVLTEIPFSETIKQATRLTTPVIPEIAIREIIGNAVIHRDYARTDSYTTVEIFSDRIEVTNPGGLIGDITLDRLLDHPPRARNEVLAELMKLLNYYEERGSGIDKTVSAMELFGMPPVEFRSSKDHFTAILYTPKSFDDMSKEERINAVYQHACLNYVCGKKTTNTTVRERFKFDESKMTKVFRLLKDAIESNRIKVGDENASRKFIYYLPYWA